MEQRGSFGGESAGGRGCMVFGSTPPQLLSLLTRSCPPQPLAEEGLLGMCYLDVAADAEGLLLRGEEGVRHLLRGGLDLLLYLLLGDNLRITHTRESNHACD